MPYWLSHWALINCVCVCVPTAIATGSSKPARKMLSLKPAAKPATTRVGQTVKIITPLITTNSWISTVFYVFIYNAIP